MKKKVPVRGHKTPAHLTLLPTKIVWEVVVIDPGSVRIAGRDEHPCIVLWSTRTKVLSVHPSIDADLPLAESYANAVKVGGARPTEVRVDHAAHVSAVQAVVGDAVHVSVGVSAEANALAQRLLDSLAPLGDAAKLDAFLAFLRAPAEVVDAFARRALDLGATEPWDIVVDDDDALRVHTPGLAPEESTVVITGQLGESYAALVFDSYEDFEAFRHGAGTDAPPTAPMAPFHAISFEPLDALGPEVVARLKRAKYPMPWKGRVPLPTLTARYDTPSPVSPGALLRLTVIADALQKLFKLYGDEIMTDPDAALRFGGSIRLQGQVWPWTVTFPHPELAAPWTPESLTDLDAITAWTELFALRHPDALRAAQREVAQAYVGRAVSQQKAETTSLNETSLAKHWAATARRLPDGRHPLDVAEAMDDLLPELARAVGLLRQQRVLLGEVLDVQGDTVTVNDLVGGGRYTLVDVPLARNNQLRRWHYLLAQVVPADDGRWSYVSLLTSQERLAEDFVAQVAQSLRAALRGLPRPATDAEGDFGALLATEFGLAHAVFMRLGEEIRARPKRVYMENSDGDRVELVTLTLALPGKRASIVSTFDAMPELVSTGDGTWAWLDTSRQSVFPEGEFVASITTHKKGCVITTNSPARAEKAVGLLRARFGAEAVELRREVVVPWQKYPGIVAEKGEGVSVRVIGNGPARAPEGGGAPSGLEMFTQHLWRVLDEHVPNLGGVPRELVKTSEGRDAVERWLREAEAIGQPGEDSPRFFDADPFRRALGLTPIRVA